MLSDLNAFMKKKKEVAKQPRTAKANEHPQVFDQLIKPQESSVSNYEDRIVNIVSNRSSQETPPYFSEQITERKPDERQDDFSENEED
jgi:hypothetical protein